MDIEELADFCLTAAASDRRIDLHSRDFGILSFVFARIRYSIRKYLFAWKCAIPYTISIASVIVAETCNRPEPRTSTHYTVVVLGPKLS